MKVRLPFFNSIPIIGRYVMFCDISTLFIHRPLTNPNINRIPNIFGDEVIIYYCSCEIIIVIIAISRKSVITELETYFVI